MSLSLVCGASADDDFPQETRHRELDKSHITYSADDNFPQEALEMKIDGVRVCVIGLWHLGCVYSACLARLGYRVLGTDDDSSIVENLRAARPPIFEPGLDHLITVGMATGNLGFVRSIEEATEGADYVMIAYDTPVDADDQPDPSIVLQAADRLKDTKSHATIIVSSQVPVGTCKQIGFTLSTLDRDLDLAYVPENLRLGQAIERFMKPEMIVIGTDNPSTMAKVRALFSPIQTKIVEMDLASAEMTKHALNAFLANSISFANEIGNICDLVGADALKIMEALRLDSRIGQKALLRPGLGFAGGTLARDLKALQTTAKRYGYRTSLINAVLDVNQRQNASVVAKLERLIGKLEGKHVGILGLTYKSGTSTLRRSIALDIIRQLQQKGVSVKAFDARVSMSDLAGETFDLCENAYAACENVDALVIMNDLPDIGNLDFKRMRQLMRNPLVFDTQNLLDRSKVTEYGIRYIGIGRGSPT